MAESKLQILIEARNRAQRELSQVDRQLDNLGGTARGVGGALAAASRALALAGAAAAAVKFGTMAFEMGRASAESMRLAGAFEDLARRAGSSGAAMLSAMREAARGTIDDTSLIAAANRAMMLGVADSADEMAQLIQIAAARGRAMGLSTQQAFSDLVTGIGRQSALILDNLGIVVDAQAAYESYARSLGRTAESLTDAERKQALLNNIVAESQDLLAENVSKGDKLASSFARMDASIENAKDALGALFSPAAAVVAENLAAATERMIQAMEDAGTANLQRDLFTGGDSLTRVVEELNRQMTRMQEAGVSGDIQALDDSAQRIEMLRMSVHALGEEYNEAARDLGVPLVDLNQLQVGVIAFKDTAEAAGEVAAAAEEARAAEERMAKATEELAARQGELRQKILESVDAFRSMREGTVASLKASFLGIAADLGADAALASYREASAELEHQRGIWAEMGLSAEELEFRERAFLSAAQDANSELSRASGLTSQIAANLGEAADAFVAFRAQLKSSYLSAVGELGATGAQAGFERSTAQLEKQARLYELMGYDAETIEFKLKALVDPITETNSELGRTARLTQRIPAYVREAQQAFEDLRGKVSGVLSGALNLDVGVDPADFLPREDAVNEDARRLADVMVRGFESPWAAYFQDRFPELFESGDIQGTAASILRDFQAGLVPELIDRETAKDRVRRMLVGDANLAQMAQEIAAELAAELGGQFSLGQIEAAATLALGVEGAPTREQVEGLVLGEGGIGQTAAEIVQALSAEVASRLDLGQIREQVTLALGVDVTPVDAGATLAGGFLDGVASQETGQKVAGILAGQIKAQAEAIRNAGKSAGSTWGGGFLATVGEGIPPALIDILTRLVTPQVWANFQRQGTLTGELP